ncbi:MAG: hypothetical protein ACW98X_15610, partial [Promethearchaeota archaeon]
MKTKNAKILLFFRFTLILVSLIFLSIILYLVVSYEIPFFDPTLDTIKIVIITLFIPLIVFISILAVFSIQEYRDYFTKRPYIKQGRSYLTLKDIFENENRLNII